MESFDYEKFMVAVDEARAHGCAVIVWTPEELGDVVAYDVEEFSIEKAIDAFNIYISV